MESEEMEEAPAWKTAAPGSGEPIVSGPKSFPRHQVTQNVLGKPRRREERITGQSTPLYTYRTYSYSALILSTSIMPPKNRECYPQHHLAHPAAHPENVRDRRQVEGWAPEPAHKAYKCPNYGTMDPWGAICVKSFSSPNGIVHHVRWSKTTCCLWYNTETGKTSVPEDIKAEYEGSKGKPRGATKKKNQNAAVDVGLQGNLEPPINAIDFQEFGDFELENNPNDHPTNIDHGGVDFPQNANNSVEPGVFDFEYDDNEFYDILGLDRPAASPPQTQQPEIPLPIPDLEAPPPYQGFAMAGSPLNGFNGDEAQPEAHGFVSNEAANPAMASQEPPALPQEPFRFIKYPLINKPDDNLLPPGANHIQEKVETPLADDLREEFWKRHSKLCSLYDAWKSDHDHFRDIFHADENIIDDARAAEAKQALQNKQKEWIEGDADFQQWRATNPAVEIIINSINEEVRLYPAVTMTQDALSAAVPAQNEELFRARSAHHRDLWNVRVRAQQDANNILYEKNDIDLMAALLQDQAQQEQPVQTSHQETDYPTGHYAEAAETIPNMDVIGGHVNGDLQPEALNNGNIQSNNTDGAQQAEL
ncbi:hypothetical protein QBC43DRAFT_352428 [Cladorrhinum sp. PSN259]|nr:hypothetical protein QBC43DRAFT_352428 [Cladorrhinum sp. PSN259]